MANAMVTKYQTKVFDLQNKADELAMAMENNPDDDDLPVQLATVKIKLDAAKMVLENAKAKERRDAERVNSPTYKAEIKHVESLQENAGKRIKEILADAEQLQTKIIELQNVVNECNRIARTHNEKIIAGTKYRMIFKLGGELKQWFKDWRMVENLSKPTPPPIERKLTQLQKDVNAMRYHEPNERPVMVRLVDNDDGSGNAKYSVSRGG
jgi:predicted  nucleic acid-binding Zn-ribbon protein